MRNCMDCVAFDAENYCCLIGEDISEDCILTDEEVEMLLVNDVEVVKDKSKAIKRKADIRHARKKRKVANDVHPREGREYFENEHQFSKNQVNKRPQHNRDISIKDKKSLEKLNVSKEDLD